MPRRNDIESILLIGSGPIVIGQACEFDYSGTQACRVLKEEGYRVILANSNPATIMTDPDFADATYIEPVTPEWVTKVIERERPDGLLPTLGGQTGLNLAVALADSLNYEVVRYTDSLSGRRFLGTRERLVGGAQTRGWGSYFLQPAFQRDALVEVPHVRFDLHSEELGARSFRDSGARGFLLAGGDRLLDQHVHSGPEAGQADAMVQQGGNGDADRIHLCQQGLVGREPAATELFSGELSPNWIRISIGRFRHPCVLNCPRLLIRNLCAIQSTLSST